MSRDLADCHELHRTILSAFPQCSGEATGARDECGVLHRLDVSRDGRVTLLVQSRERPDWSRLESGYLLATGGNPENPAYKRVDERYASIRLGMTLAFRLRANPTRKIDTRSRPDGQRRNGKRVDLRGETAQLDWLRRKAEQCGFELLDVQVGSNVPDVRMSEAEKAVGARLRKTGAGDAGERQRLTFGAVMFEGRLRVTNPERFRLALERGVGSGKAYGFGLLSVAPSGA